MLVRGVSYGRDNEEVVARVTVTGDCRVELVTVTGDSGVELVTSRSKQLMV